MKTIKPEAEFTAEQLNRINELAEQTGLCAQTVAILYGRGVDTADKIEGFMNPSQKRFLSPFLMSGMNEAVALITRARDEGWSVVVYGDYDADGICATIILARALADFGIQATVRVPERKNGYGLNIPLIDELFEEYFPQLFITVDCGISNAEEVEYIKEQGAEVIITDHHELPDVLPDCICINPKFKDDYPYDNLCGAGVAFKLGCALNGKSAYSYLDYAAIATVADSVPILGENRDIVAEGLNLINARPRKNYAYFLNKNGETTTAQSLAFSVAPKINAAGRMGDAAAALTLFLSEDEKEIYDYCVKLNEYNVERQKYCDELYVSAKQKIKSSGANERVIILWDENWNSGFVGIVAARLAEEYCKPTLLFVKNGDMLKGSARSIEEVNIFEALKACEDLISEFGGHSQAAGVNILEENLQPLKSRLDAFLHSRYTSGAFVPTCLVNGSLNAPLSRKFVMELEKMEPFGVGNRRPEFILDATALAARQVKPNSLHLSVKSELLEMMCFSGVKYKRLLQSDLPKRVIFEYNVSTYKNRQYIKGFIRDIVYSAEDCVNAGEITGVNLLNNFVKDSVDCDVSYIDKSEAEKMIANRREYGTVFILNDAHNIAKYNLDGMGINIFILSSNNLATTALVSPQEDCDLSGFENVVFLDDVKKITLKSLEGKKVKVCNGVDGLAPLRSLKADREELLGLFRLIASYPDAYMGENAEDLALSMQIDVPKAQVFFALKVFEQLNLIAFEGGSLTVYKGVKTQLTASPLFNAVAEICN